VAHSQKAIVAIPITIPVVEVEVTLGIVPVQVEHIAIKVDLSNRALCKKPSKPLLPDHFAKAVSNS